MASYSKVFKASNVSLMGEVKVITPPVSLHMTAADEEFSLPQAAEEDAGIQKSSEMLEEAKEQAEAIIAAAEQHAQAIETAAEGEINQWWEENQKKLESMSLEAQQQGYMEGLARGKEEAETAVRKEYEGQLAQINQLLQQSYEEKEAIVSEAEPFLLELSTVIATQIIKQELESNPEKFVELIKQHILRFKEKEFITICVHPADFDFIQSQRAHLIAVVNGETEIRIIPDHSVTEKGCIIRTAYGSIDARIDTQIEEIKRVILEARRTPESETIS